MVLFSDSVNKTKMIGKKFASLLNKGDVVLLGGELGVGKTVFIKGILEGFNFPSHEVISPSFTLIREYRIKNFPIYHIDLYRIRVKEELINLGYEDYFYSPQGITLIEWGDRVEDILNIYIKVELSFVNEMKRKISIVTKGYSHEKNLLLDSLRI
ncbi:MAG: tRNA (adenosine(37)-N6)-threonylcarbamoyltransferase complex ATPase subunit type 1 TsaE [Candidatus Omnitrophica bacterium]|nr:tRNA (adenosine(37)-N6)-threonylcarbamoyltransferase complex ATPase subunit type 1 TsaE [Candidatus Omnitrophota bacterium]